MNRYEERGELAEALVLAQRLFGQHLDLAGYRKVQGLARRLGVWQASRPELLAKWAAARQYGLLTDIHLEEGEIDLALKSVRRQRQVFSHGGNRLMRVARAAEETRPQAAIEIYREQAERLVEARGRDNYQQACVYRLLPAFQRQLGLVQQDHPEQLRRRVPEGLRLPPLHIPPQADVAHEATQQIQAHQGFLPRPRALLAGHSLRETRMRAATGLAGTFLELPHGIPSHDTFGRVSGVSSRGWIPTAGRLFRPLGAVAGRGPPSPGHVGGGQGSPSFPRAGRVCHPCTWSVLGQVQHTWSWASSGWTTTPMKSRPFQNCSRCWCLRATKSPGPPSLRAFRRSRGLAGG